MILVVLTSLSIVLAAIGVWAHNAVLDTDNFMVTVGPALDDPALYDAVGERVGAQAVEALDLETRISTALAQLDDFLFGALLDALDIGDRGRGILESVDRPALEDLAPTLSSGLEDRITARIEGFISSEEFRAAVPALVRRAHAGVIALARGDMEQIPNVSVADGEVTLNTIPLVGEVIRRVLPDLSGLGSEVNLPDRLSDRVEEARAQLEEALNTSLPDDFGQLNLMTEDQLNQLQDGVVSLDRMMWALISLAVILLAVTLLVSPNRPRTAIHIAIGVVVAIVVALLSVSWVQNGIVDAIVDPEEAEAAGQIISGVLSSLRQGVVLIALIAIMSAVYAWFISRSPKAPDAAVGPVSG